MDVIKIDDNRLGEENVSNFGTKMKIIKYEGWDKVTVEFENGGSVVTRYEHFKDGSLKSPYDKVVYNVGYLGEGKYRPSKNNIHNVQYKYWRSMLERAYDKKYSNKFPTYKDVTVDDKWHNYQEFCKWYDKNYYTVENEKMCLDKDILFKGNKIYSENNCIFVPERINTLFTKGDSKREFKNEPIGVQKKTYKTCIRYKAFCSVYNQYKYKSENVNLGNFNTELEAFNVYKSFKEQYIKQVAEEYKDKIPNKLYQAMHNYKVEITD